MNVSDDEEAVLKEEQRARAEASWRAESMPIDILDPLYGKTRAERRALKSRWVARKRREARSNLRLA